MSTFFHISWFRIFIISYDIGGHLESEIIVNNNIISIPFFSRVYITYWDFTIFRYLCLFKGFSFNMCLFRGFLFNMCLFKGFLLYLCLLWGYRFINFKLISYFFMASFRVINFSWVLIFQGVTSFEPTDLPCFERILD